MGNAGRRYHETSGRAALQTVDGHEIPDGSGRSFSTAGGEFTRLMSV